MLISLEISEVYLASWRELKDYDVRGGGGGGWPVLPAVLQVLGNNISLASGVKGNILENWVVPVVLLEVNSLNLPSS